MKEQQPEKQNKKVVPLRVPPELDARLEALAKKTGRTKTFYIQEAIEEYLEEREDYLLAVAVLERNEPIVSLAELAKRFGMLTEITCSTQDDNKNGFSRNAEAVFYSDVGSRKTGA